MKTSHPNAATLLMLCFISPVGLQIQAQEQSLEQVEVIEVNGIKRSIKASMNEKRFAKEVKDVISAEDIGQLPDENIAEALQRVTGIQMSRSSDGEGSTVQIRGISNNNVEINGQTLAGTSANRSVNFQDIPSELFSSIEVLKAPTADRIEGSLGGTINLKTKRVLEMSKPSFVSLSASAKYLDKNDKVDPDVNFFAGQQWHDTAFGDVGVMLSAGRKTVSSYTESSDGTDDGIGGWLRRSGDMVPAAPFNTGTAAGNWRYDDAIDTNRDGVSDEKDVFYMKQLYIVSVLQKESERDSLGLSLQWQPVDAINLFFDATYTASDSWSRNSQFHGMRLGRPQAMPVAGGDNQYMLLADQPNGEFYYMTKGRVSGANSRMGGLPSNGFSDSKSQKYTLGGDYAYSESLLLSAELSFSEGTKETNSNSTYMMVDWNHDSDFGAADWSGIVDFDLTKSDIVDFTAYESPFYSDTPDTLVPFDSANIMDPHYLYVKMDRAGTDVRNKDVSFKFDGTYQLDGDIFTQLKAGARVAERSFSNEVFANYNGSNNKFIGDQRVEVAARSIKVNPEANTDPQLREYAEKALQCHEVIDDNVMSDKSGNIGRTITDATCTFDFFQDLFGLPDLRAVNPQTGVGYYQYLNSSYEVTEKTTALYMRADFSTELGGYPIYGNAGLRYVKTDTTSSGYYKVKSDQWDPVTLKGSYDNVLPTLNINLGFSQDLLLRTAYYRAIARPAVTDLSPGLRVTLDGEDSIPGYDGSGSAGNPNLQAMLADNLDLSLEWYFSEESMLATAVFFKDIDSSIGYPAYELDMVIDGLLYKVNQKVNLPGTQIKGIEANWVQSFGFTDIPYVEHSGLSANFTYSHEDSEMVDDEGSAIPRVGLSKYSYNLTAFYDDGTFSLRLAYNWRDTFVRNANLVLGYGTGQFLPEMEHARGQLDISANYNITPALKLTFSAVNVDNQDIERYLKYRQLTNYVGNAGAKYNLGLQYRF
ncbi:TonB-dependent receptor [Bowmanella sp. Y26]|uniref:TonB-dependent receptor n=1 Tax=Bowmanella yangjiangensis TaxID=2811230 RepID=UPI001BDCB590|nr:TonB-dependent receptor [Bowmanella yangjiangensis]MBT1063377.1 TonB-dependent receptor [Bowmanella yangjiangensis]